VSDVAVRQVFYRRNMRLASVFTNELGHNMVVMAYRDTVVGKVA